MHDVVAAGRRRVAVVGHLDFEAVAPGSADHDPLPAGIEAERQIPRRPGHAAKAQGRPAAHVGSEGDDGRVPGARLAQQEREARRVAEPSGAYHHRGAAAPDRRMEQPGRRATVEAREAAPELVPSPVGHRRCGTEEGGQRHDRNENGTAASYRCHLLRDHCGAAPLGAEVVGPQSRCLAHHPVLPPPPPPRHASQAPCRAPPAACPGSAAGHPSPGLLAAARSGASGETPAGVRVALDAGFHPGGFVAPPFFGPDARQRR